MPRFALSLEKSDIQEIDRQAELQNIGRSKVILKAIKYAIAEKIITYPINQQKDVRTIIVYCTNKEHKAIESFCKKHNIVKSRWIASLFVDKESPIDSKLKTIAQRLDTELTYDDLKKIKERFSLFLNFENLNIIELVVKQYFLNK